MDSAKFTSEIWRSVLGFDGIYEVSNRNRIRSVDRVGYDGRKLKGVFIQPSCTTSNGKYYQYRVVLRKDNKSFTKLLHQIVAFAFPEICGEYFDGAEIDHLNGDSLDCRPENLKWVDHKTNTNNPITREKWNEARKTTIIQLTTDGKFVKEWTTARQAELYFKGCRGIIAYHIKKGTPYKGFMFRYKNSR